MGQKAKNAGQKKSKVFPPKKATAKSVSCSKKMSVSHVRIDFPNERVRDQFCAEALHTEDGILYPRGTAKNTRRCLMTKS